MCLIYFLTVCFLYLHFNIMHSNRVFLIYAVFQSVFLAARLNSWQWIFGVRALFLPWIHGDVTNTVLLYFTDILCIYKSYVIYIYTYLSIHRSIHPSIYIDRSIYPAIQLSIYPSIHRSIDLSIHRSIDPSIHPSI